jgi:hypothetical protein
MNPAQSSSGLDLRDRGRLLNRLWKWLRRTFLLNWLVGWKTLDEQNPTRCCAGHVAELGIADDGDIVIHLKPPSSKPDPRSGAEPAWDCAPLLNERNREIGLVCELPLGDRPRFDNLTELRTCLEVRICGRWVCDRGHGHNELHPISSIEILTTGT